MRADWAVPLLSWVLAGVIGTAAADARGQEPASEAGAPSDLRLPPKEGTELGPLAAMDLQEAARLAKQGKLEEAAQRYQDVLLDAPDHLGASLGLASVRIRQGRDREALELMEPLLEKHPENVMLLNNMGWVLSSAADRSLRDGLRAVDFARKAVVLAPSNYHVWSTLAESYYISGNFQKAHKAAVEALNLAKQAKLPAVRLVDYQDQVAKCARALKALSLLE